MQEPIVPDFCHFWLGWDGWKKLPVVQKVMQVMIVTPSNGAYILDLEDLSFSCLGYNEVSSAVKVRSFFGHVDVATCAFIEVKILLGCVEVAQKLKQF